MTVDAITRRYSVGEAVSFPGKAAPSPTVQYKAIVGQAHRLPILRRQGGAPALQKNSRPNIQLPPSNWLIPSMAGELPMLTWLLVCGAKDKAGKNATPAPALA
jgi:hypothetical protein